MIEFVSETGSTNADLAARLRGGDFVPEGDWLVADRQAAGRGRQGREWFDGAGNFMGSTVVHRRFGDPQPASLALMAGVALYEAVDWHLPEGVQAVLKWPNDLMIGSAKLGGILLERIQETVVVGIGVNLAYAPALPGRTAVAIADHGSAPDRDIFAADLAKFFDIELERWRNFGMAPLVRRWAALAHPVGTMLQVAETAGEGLVGRFAGLSNDGSLQLSLADGTTRVIHVGDVFLAHDHD